MVARTTGLFAFFDLEDASDCRSLSRDLRQALRDRSGTGPRVHLQPPRGDKICQAFERASTIEMLIQHMERSPVLNDIINDYLNSGSGDIPILASAKSMDSYAQPEALYPRGENYEAAESAWRTRRPLGHPPNFKKEYLPCVTTDSPDETGSMLDTHKGSAKHDKRGLELENSNVTNQGREFSTESNIKKPGSVTINRTIRHQDTKRGKSTSIEHKLVDEESFEDDDEIKPPGRWKRKSASSSVGKKKGHFLSPPTDHKANNKKKRVAVDHICSPTQLKRARKEVAVNLSVRILQERPRPPQPALANFQVNSTSSPSMDLAAFTGSISDNKPTTIPIDTKLARLGEVDTSKLEIVLEVVQEDPEHPGKRVPVRCITKKYEHTVNFCSIEHVNNLNIWRNKIISEALNIGNDRSRLTNTRWLQIEKSYILELLEQQLNSGQRAISWSCLADQYNKGMMGTIQAPGEAFVLRKWGKVEMMVTPRLGPFRGQHAIKLQIGIWPESRKLIEDAKKEPLPLRSLTRIRRSSSRKGDAESDDQGAELGEDSEAMKQALAEHHVTMDVKKCSSNGRPNAQNPILITSSSPSSNTTSSVFRKVSQDSAPENLMDLDSVAILALEPWTDADAEEFDSQAVLEELLTDENDDDFPGDIDDNSSSDESSSSG